MNEPSRLAAWMLVIMAVVSLGAWAQEPTADEILARVEETSIMGGEVGTMVATVRFEVAVEEGEPTAYTFRVFSAMDVEGEPDKLLIVYLDPELVAGTMFLTHTPEEGDARMWLYLPALGLVKELVTEEARGQEFISGSGISRSEIAEGFQYHEDYSPVLTGEEEIDGLPAYVLLLTPREGRETDWQSIKLWVYKGEFAVIRAEFTDSEGRLAKVMEGDDFYADSVSFFSHTITFQDLIGGGSSLITLLDREIADISPDHFVPESLPTLVIENLSGD